jgi:hypothetical protein
MGHHSAHHAVIRCQYKTIQQVLFYTNPFSSRLLVQSESKMIQHFSPLHYQAIPLMLLRKRHPDLGQ